MNGLLPGTCQYCKSEIGGKRGIGGGLREARGVPMKIQQAACGFSSAGERNGRQDAKQVQATGRERDTRGKGRRGGGEESKR